jgi:hypothetical protein
LFIFFCRGNNKFIGRKKVAMPIDFYMKGIEELFVRVFMEEILHLQEK